METNLTAQEIASQTGCSLEVAAECIAKRPGNAKAQVALARLKMPVAKVEAIRLGPVATALPRGYEPAGACRCTCCGYCKPLNRQGCCYDCTGKGSRMWLRGRSKFNAKPHLIRSPATTPKIADTDG